jgi:hypothetical protein
MGWKSSVLWCRLPTRDRAEMESWLRINQKALFGCCSEHPVKCLPVPRLASACPKRPHFLSHKVLSHHGTACPQITDPAWHRRNSDAPERTTDALYQPSEMRWPNLCGILTIKLLLKKSSLCQQFWILYTDNFSAYSSTSFSWNNCWGN